MNRSFTDNTKYKNKYFDNNPRLITIPKKNIIQNFVGFYTSPCKKNGQGPKW